ncbi:MAG: hypothetical protein GW854_13690 [Erythrobacter sp.]|nr:hypothetical protein [Erythrobacter sp.]
MSNDAKVKAVLAANFSEECGDPSADAKEAATNALQALQDEGFIVARDPEHGSNVPAHILPFQRDAETRPD